MCGCVDGTAGRQHTACGECNTWKRVCGAGSAGLACHAGTLTGTCAVVVSRTMACEFAWTYRGNASRIDMGAACDRGAVRGRMAVPAHERRVSRYVAVCRGLPQSATVCCARRAAVRVHLMHGGPTDRTAARLDSRGVGQSNRRRRLDTEIEAAIWAYRDPVDVYGVLASASSLPLVRRRGSQQRADASMLRPRARALYRCMLPQLWSRSQARVALRRPRPTQRHGDPTRTGDACDRRSLGPGARSLGRAQDTPRAQRPPMGRNPGCVETCATAATGRRPTLSARRCNGIPGRVCARGFARGAFRHPTTTRVCRPYHGVTASGRAQPPQMYVAPARRASSPLQKRRSDARTPHGGPYGCATRAARRCARLRQPFPRTHVSDTFPALRELAPRVALTHGFDVRAAWVNHSRMRTSPFDGPFDARSTALFSPTARTSATSRASNSTPSKSQH